MNPGLFRTLLVIGLVYMVIRFWRMVQANNQNHSQSSASSNRKEEGSRKEGDVTIENIPEDYKRSNRNKQGDYVDFEEVDPDSKKD